MNENQGNPNWPYGIEFAVYLTHDGDKVKNPPSCIGSYQITGSLLELNCFLRLR